MRILQVVIGYHPARGEFGGIVETVEHLSAELLRRGHEVEVWTSALVGRGRHLARREVSAERGGLRIRYFPAFHPAPLGYGFAFSPAFARAVTREVSEFDVVHVNGYRNHLAVSAMVAAGVAGVPYVVQTHGTIPPVVHRVRLKRAFDRMVGRTLLSGAGAIVAISHAEARLFAEHGVSPEEVDVVYNGIDVGMVGRDLGAGDWFAAVLGIRAPRVLLYLGRLHERKGVQHLVTAFDGLAASRDDVHLVIAGSDDGFESALRQQVARCARRDRITFAGPIYGDAKYRAYRSAALLVYPAVHEYFGLVPFEALLCGTPAVVVEGEGCAEVLADVDGGWTVPWADPAALTRVVEGALAEQHRLPGESARRVHAAQQRILARYTWSAAAERLLGVYERVRGLSGPLPAGLDPP
jgi:glycosyltransferase involved in cell wall biosynthesis